MFTKDNHDDNNNHQCDENQILEYEWTGNFSDFIQFLKSKKSPKMGRVANMLFSDLYTNDRNELQIKRRHVQEPDTVHIGDLITYDPNLDIDANYFITRKSGIGKTDLPYTFFRHEESALGYISHLTQFMSMDMEGIDPELTITIDPPRGLIIIKKGEDTFQFDPRTQTLAYHKENQKYSLCDKSFARIIS